jgi:hypothetical protein
MNNFEHPKIKTNNDKVAFQRKAKHMFVSFYPLCQVKHHMKKTFVKGTKLGDTNARSNI